MEDPSLSQQVVFGEVSPKNAVEGTELSKGQGGTALSCKFPACCHLNSLFIHLQVAQHSHPLLPNPICPISVTTANGSDVWWLYRNLYNLFQPDQGTNFSPCLPLGLQKIGISRQQCRKGWERWSVKGKQRSCESLGALPGVFCWKMSCWWGAVGAAGHRSSPGIIWTQFPLAPASPDITSAAPSGKNRNLINLPIPLIREPWWQD